MNAPAVLLRALKGTCALNCLAALHLAGPLPVSIRAVIDLTGFEDGAVRRGLNTLLVLGLATCTGDTHRTAWQLAPAARSLPLPLYPFLESPQKRDSESLKEEDKEIVESINVQSTLDLTSCAADPAKAGITDDAIDAHDANDTSVANDANDANVAVSGELTADLAPAQGHSRSTTAHPAPGHKPAPPAPPATPFKTLESWSLRGEEPLRQSFYQAFESANIYLQFRRPLADALLAEDGPAWLRHALGWLCYAQRRLPHVQRGAIVYISLRDRLPCDSAYQPPPELPFEAALAWALRGGEPETPPEPDNNDQTLRVCAEPTLKVSDAPEDQLWRAVLEKLSRQLSPAVIDSQLRQARLICLEQDQCLIAAPTPQSRDWLATRLAGVLERALRELTGRELKVEVVCEI